MLLSSLALLSLSLLHLGRAAPATARAECTLDFPGLALAGRATDGGACRYTVQYAQARRWEDAVPMMDQSKHDATTLPPVCPQTPGGPMLVSSPGQDEQCLYAVVYTPKTAKRGDRLPVFVWIHGGSFYAGSASSPGLDGSVLATKGNMIVVVLQYRLGILGLLPPSSSPASGDASLAIKDVILALTQIQSYAEWIGGDRGRVTLGGQSSGASMIRALLAAPRAKGLFRAAVLQSDPMTYGTASASITSRLQQMFYSQPALAFCSDFACLQRIPVGDILKGQAGFIVAAPSQVPGVPVVTPLRPTHNTPTLPLESTSQAFSTAYTLPSPPIAVPLLITTTSNEAGQVVGSLFPRPIPADNATYTGVLSVFVNPSRAGVIANSSEYAMTGKKGEDEFRQTFERLVSDGVWRCPSRDFAGRWAEQGGKVWVGEWTKGVGYASNVGGGYCGQQGRVCHEDDIFPTFRMTPSPNAETAALQDKVLSHWSAFIHNLDPNISPPLLPAPPPKPGGAEIGIALPVLPGGIGSELGIPKHIDCTIRHRNLSCPSDKGPKPQPKPKPKPEPVVGPKQHESRAERWDRYTGNEGQVYALGGGKVGGCPKGFWGEKVRYDWQLY
ncbi:Alpha/Beta hydrolase protein [Dioszegia hungarica]|uniref:Alpha/Beta hydrolase protein n=1 Tax=Dioszegia hungarica TaxID=4972 RepID=A0AA38H325_9TREE|nr:Alpha/Beta hydrolase protein [Dioszegia hungarica]KAI9632736.1 Alpha/Beta hydrolase protein [Dioszegia hungarica]